MDETTFDTVAREELSYLEDALANVDPDDVEVTSSDGVLRLGLRDGTKIVINSHRAARQIWMAAVASAWHFDPPGGPPPGAVRSWTAGKSGEQLRPTLARLIKDRIGLDLRL